jgi:hypothetical protein
MQRNNTATLGDVACRAPTQVRFESNGLSPYYFCKGPRHQGSAHAAVRAALFELINVACLHEVGQMAKLARIDRMDFEAEVDRAALRPSARPIAREILAEPAW